ncbi:hypothetical protein LX32DRAFT_392028 [Colletotrichum zoysiae]|uniref:Uncharacterized protein n=1 Tax=Colletotrichum zoysiae TaxID=1216348 RepID=A0AAD9HI99_9PEZI|nr:hypothetical protein LX32DRAFT_392028 [Colletotrichum zoysiae]
MRVEPHTEGQGCAASQPPCGLHSATSDRPATPIAPHHVTAGVCLRFGCQQLTHTHTHHKHTDTHTLYATYPLSTLTRAGPQRPFRTLGGLDALFSDPVAGPVVAQPRPVSPPSHDEFCAHRVTWGPSASVKMSHRLLLAAGAASSVVRHSRGRLVLSCLVSGVGDR